MVSRNEILNLNELDLIKLAKNSNDGKILALLSNSIFATVRRCVAKNLHSSIKTINKLAADSACNVSYWAIKNSHCTKSREIDESHPCVLCEIDEADYPSACASCTKIKCF